MPVTKNTPLDNPAQPSGGMWHDDIVFGGEQLEPNVTLDREYVLWNCGIVARNVQTSLGDDGVKAEVVISQVEDDDVVSAPRKFGTFASAIVGKVEKRAEGDLPAVVKFEKVKSSYDTDAFVMTFVRRHNGIKTPGELPVITTL